MENATPNAAGHENDSRDTEHEFCSFSPAMSYAGSFLTAIMSSLDPDDVNAMIQDPIANNKMLRDLSLQMYSMNGTYTNVVDYMTSMPTLSKIIVPHGDNRKRRAANKLAMSNILKGIRDEEIIRDALMKGMVLGVAFYYFETKAMPYSKSKVMNDFEVTGLRETNEGILNASVIPLPVDYTKIVGRKNSSYVIAFNLEYFDTTTNEKIENRLRKYPEEIRKAYSDRKKGRSGGNWVVLDNTKTIVHKVRSQINEVWGRPLVLAAISDILYRDYFTDTKRHVLDEINNRIVYQTFPEGKEKGKSALTRAQQTEQHDTVKTAVLQKNNRGGLSFFSVAAGTKIDSLSTSNTDIFDDKNETNLDNKIALDLGFAGNALSGSGSGSYSAQESNLELVTSQVFQWVKQIQDELNKCINLNLIKDKKNHVEAQYLPITHLNRKTMVGYAKDLYLQGCGSLSLWAATCGIAPEAFYALLDEETENGIYDKYKPHQTSYTLSGKQPGRPVTDEPTDNTILSRSNGGNNVPTPSDR